MADRSFTGSFKEVHLTNEIESLCKGSQLEMMSQSSFRFTFYFLHKCFTLYFLHKCNTLIYCTLHSETRTTRHENFSLM